VRVVGPNAVYGVNRAAAAADIDHAVPGDMADTRGGRPDALA
jgi:hypothetical protein